MNLDIPTVLREANEAMDNYRKIAEQKRLLREAVLMAIGFHAGMSIIPDVDELNKRLVKVIKDTE